MRIYVAGSYAFRLQMLELTNIIVRALPDCEITSHWIYQGEEAEELSKKGHQHFIDMDVEDLRAADLVLLVNQKDMSTTSPGKWVELGMALEMKKLVVIWGDSQETLFSHDKSVISQADPSVGLLLDSLRVIERVLNKTGHAHGT